MNIKSIIILIMLMCIAIPIYAENKYELADSYLSSGDYEMAVDEYQKILEEKGPAALSKDVRAMVGKIISLYKIKKYKQSFAVCKRVLKLERYNSVTILYAGLNLEAMQNPVLALKIYQYYEFVKTNDPYRYYIKARHDILKEQEIQARVDKTIEVEGRLSNQRMPDNSIAVLYLLNKSVDASWDALSKGLCQLLIEDLSVIKKLKVVSRVELQLLLEKLNFDPTALNDENLIPRFGRLLNSQYVVNGAFEVDANKQIHINLGILNLSQPDMIKMTEFNGRVKNIFDLEKQIAAHVANRIGVVLSKEELKLMKRKQTNNVDAFLAYCRGLDLLDYGNPDGAYSNFSLAQRYDSGFLLALDMKETIDAMITMQTEDLALKHFEILGRKNKIFTASAGQSSMKRSRLQSIMINLDLGYLPGSESRKGPEGVDPAAVIARQKMLPEPPTPPAN